MNMKIKKGDKMAKETKTKEKKTKGAKKSVELLTKALEELNNGNFDLDLDIKDKSLSVLATGIND